MADPGYNANKGVAPDYPGHIGFSPPPHAPGAPATSYHEPPPSYFNNQSLPIDQIPTTTASATIVIHQPALGSSPTRITCPHCLADVTTRVNYTSGTMTHVLACVLCCFVCWPFAWVPYATDCSKDADHECPNCQRHIGTYKR